MHVHGGRLLFLFFVPVSAQCPPPGFTSVNGFNLNQYIAKPWYIQQQMPVQYQQPDNFYCVTARYELRTTPSIWGYDINVYNQAENAQGDQQNNNGQVLCADVVDEEKGQLRVAPCAVPSSLAGAYWILEFNDELGYAIVSGGPPTIDTGNGCRTGTGTNNAGLWLFTRAQQRNEAIVQRMRDETAAKGFDLSVLQDVDQSVCPRNSGPTTSGGPTTSQNAQTTTAPATTSKESNSSSDYLWLWILLGILGLCQCLALCAALAGLASLVCGWEEEEQESEP